MIPLRWSFLGCAVAVGLGLIFACAPAAPAPPTGKSSSPMPAAAAKSAASPAAEGWQAEWDKTVAAARQEGRLVMMTHPGTDYQGLVAAFQAAYPDITVEHAGIRPSDFAPRLVTEQKNGQFLWDVMTASTSNMVTVLSPTGAFQDLRPFILLPDATDSSKWAGGFEMWAHDVSKEPLVFVIGLDVTGGYAVNRTVVPRGELTSVDDLVDPRWKGKIVIDDPSVPAHGSLFLTGILRAKGEDFVRKLLVDQRPVIQENVRITTEWVATGRYPIAIGVDDNFFEELLKQGVGKDTETRQGPLYMAARGVGVFKNAPNPNAARVWVNWLLSQEGQRAWSEHVGNSRRTDVPVRRQAEYPDFTRLDSYASPNTERDKTLLGTIFRLYRESKSG